MAETSSLSAKKAGVQRRETEADAIGNSTGPYIRIADDERRRLARERGPRASIFSIFIRQAYTETAIRLRKNINFRKRENLDACKAYCAMTLEDFDGINARQAWANWRTIPRNLDGRLPNRPIRVVDLCCGTGQSTEVLACYAAPGSKVVGLEYNPEFVRHALSRRYLDASGNPANVSFRAQSVLDPFHDADHRPIPDGSVDLINASGAIGCHFDAPATKALASEIMRVLKPAGLAMIDSGSHGTSTSDLSGIFRYFGFEVLNRAKSCFLDRYTQVCLRKR